MVGSGTVLADDPRLTTRIAEGGRDPVRIVLDGSLKTSPTAAVYAQESDAQSVLITSMQHAEETLQTYRDAGVKIIAVAHNSDGLDLRAALLELGKMGIQYLLLEGGSTLAGAMMRADLVDRVMIFVAPKVLGGAGQGLLAGQGVANIVEASTLTNLRARQIDTDILLEGEVQHVHRID
jgi:diaminohydroxyphosphoribosylaminopyrimidine deaminase/5-amino-6-(5-phosphoribosylamino)uracil reductase